MDNYLEKAKVFKVLGDPKRMMIVDMLSCQELCACEILKNFKMTHSTLSHHMKLLCECELVLARIQGKWTYYTLNLDTFQKAQDFLSVIIANKEKGIDKTLMECD